MKVVMLMFDSLNRHMLPPYGCNWVHAPNFRRLAEKTVTFDRSYVCSMPCMPARRDLHTGRPNFLHRSWGPIEPFDDSIPEMLKRDGVYTHLTTDHYHYFEEGGCNYHTRYSTWEFFRGQEGDPWVGQVAACTPPNAYGRNASIDRWHCQDNINRMHMRREELQPQSRTVAAGLEFIDRNRDDDNWLLQIETFDPHEPFFSQRKYKDLYPEHYAEWRAKGGPEWDWPPYSKVTESEDMVEHMRYETAALVSMCDAKLGDVLDKFDEHDLWDDTMLIVWTDHGFLLGEHDSWAKCWVPFYEEVSHTPFFVWDPRSKVSGERRQALIQPAIDLGPTLLDFFGKEGTGDMLGKPLGDAIADDSPVRDAAIFGMFGAHVNVTDGRYVYWRGASGEDNTPLYEHTLMPTHMKRTFGVEELRDRTELCEPLSFTKGCRPMKIDAGGPAHSPRQRRHFPTRLFDLEADPRQQSPIQDGEIESRLIERMIALMRECDCPESQFERLGLPEPMVGTK